MEYKTAKKKADDLLAKGDALIAAGKKDEGKRLLRKCRRLLKIKPHNQERGR